MASTVKWVDPSIVVKNVAKSVAWYRQMLGMKVEMAMPDPKQPTFVRLTNGQVAIMLSDGSNPMAPRRRIPAATAQAVAARKAQRVVYFYFRVDDGVDALYRSVRRKGAKIERPLAEQPYEIGRAHV